MAAKKRALAAPFLLFLVCSLEDGGIQTQGFLIRISQSAPSRSSRCRCGYSVNDYFANLNRKESDDEKKSIGVSDFLQSLSRSGEAEDSPGGGDERKPRGGGGRRGGMFDVQNDYFRSLGGRAAHADAGDAQQRPQSAASEQSDVGGVDGWDSAALLNFNIGRPGPATTADPWRTAAARQQNPRQPTPEELHGMTHEEVVAFNDARLCPKMLLTQRAVQSFIELCQEVRDPHSGKWLEEFLRLRNLGRFHGTGAFDVTRYPTWDAILYDILRQPKEKMIVSAKRRGRGHGGWSRNNPHLQERWVEFPIDIRPASLVHRILHVRRQLAEEFLGSLRLMRTVDEYIQNAYFDITRDTGSALAPADFGRLSTDCLASAADYDEDGGASPLFRANFDLLHNLCTQAAAHRLLRDPRFRSQDGPSHTWFLQFYADNVPRHFDGHQSLGRADAFMDGLVNTPPALALSPAGEPMGWADPVGVAEKIIVLRSEVAAEWMGALGTMDEEEQKLNSDVTRMMFGQAFEASEVRSVLDVEEEQTLGEIPDAAWE